MACQDLSVTLKLSGKQCKERVVGSIQPGECHYMGESKF